MSCNTDEKKPEAEAKKEESSGGFFSWFSGGSEPADSGKDECNACPGGCGMAKCNCNCALREHLKECCGFGQLPALVTKDTCPVPNVKCTEVPVKEECVFLPVNSDCAPDVRVIPKSPALAACKPDKPPCSMPDTDTTACIPLWICPPAQSALRAFAAPDGVVVRPISAQARKSNRGNGPSKCGECGTVTPDEPISPNNKDCPMFRPRCPDKREKGEKMDQLGQAKEEGPATVFAKLGAIFCSKAAAELDEIRQKIKEAATKESCDCDDCIAETAKEGTNSRISSARENIQKCSQKNNKNAVNVFQNPDTCFQDFKIPAGTEVNRPQSKENETPVTVIEKVSDETQNQTGSSLKFQPKQPPATTILNCAPVEGPCNEVLIPIQEKPVPESECQKDNCCCDEAIEKSGPVMEQQPLQDCFQLSEKAVVPNSAIKTVEISEECSESRDSCSCDSTDIKESDLLPSLSVEEYDDDEDCEPEEDEVLLIFSKESSGEPLAPILAKYKNEQRDPLESKVESSTQCIELPPCPEPNCEMVNQSVAPISPPLELDVVRNIPSPEVQALSKSFLDTVCTCRSCNSESAGSTSKDQSVYEPPKSNCGRCGENRGDNDSCPLCRFVNNIRNSCPPKVVEVVPDESEEDCDCPKCVSDPCESDVFDMDQIGKPTYEGGMCLTRAQYFLWKLNDGQPSFKDRAFDGQILKGFGVAVDGEEELECTCEEHMKMMEEMKAKNAYVGGMELSNAQSYLWAREQTK